MSSFVGRLREIARATEILRRRDVRLVTLHGPGGVGKTRLAIRLANGLVNDFSGGNWFVALAAIRDPALVASAITQTLGIQDTGTRTLDEAIQGFLGEGRSLLILDNFEHVLEAGPLVADLLAACPSLTVLVTSRAVLRLTGEHDIAIPPLQALDARNRPPLADLAETEAVQLFVERARAARDDFALTDGNADAIAEMCWRLDGLPLAIELAAPWVRVLPPEALLARLEQRLPLLTGGPHDQPARLRSMRDAIGWSYDLLSPEEQSLFRRLAVFVGGCTLVAAEAVAARTGDLDIEPIEGIASLVDKSLLRQEKGADGELRFVMLETIREYGLDQLAASGEEAATQSRHASYYLTLAERAAPDPPGGQMMGPALLMLEAEHPSLRAALTWLAEQAETEACLRLACFLGQFWYQHAYFSEGRRWLEQALAQAATAPAELRAEAMWYAGMLAHYLGDGERAIPLLETSLDLSQELGGTWVTPFGLLLLGVVAEDQGRYDDAAPLLEEARTAAERLGHPTAPAYILGHIATVAYGQGDLSRATAVGEEALRLARAREETYAATVALRCLGLTACARGDFVGASSHLAEALALDRAQGNRESIGHDFARFAVVAAGIGHVDAAARLLGAAEALREDAGSVLAWPERGTYERAASIARGALSDEAFAAAWATGRAATVDENVAVVHEVATAATTADSSVGRHAAAASHGLTPRELDVLKLVALGLSNREIAAALLITVPTVKRHTSNILGKLELPSRSAAAAYAHTHGLV